MGPEGWVLVIGAAGAQLAMLLKTWQTGKAVGSPNGSGSLHDVVKLVCEKVDKLTDRVDRLEHSQQQ